MRICIYGAGAVGGHMAARLMLAGVPASVVGRGQQLEAIREHGLTLVQSSGTYTVRPLCAECAETLGRQDVIVVAVKAPSLRSIAKDLEKLLHGNSYIVFVTNGIPWWFADSLSLATARTVSPVLDPDGILHRTVPLNRTVACVVYSGSEVIGPGVVRNTTPDRNRLILGMPNGSTPGPLRAFVTCLSKSGFEVDVTTDIREEIWSKLLSIVSLSPVAALTRKTSRAVCSDRGLRTLCEAMMREAQSVGQALGLAVAVNVGERMDPERHTDHKPSLLQDLEARRPLELDSGIIAFQRLARVVAIPTPAIDTVAALLLARANPDVNEWSR